MWQEDQEFLNCSQIPIRILTFLTFDTLASGYAHRAVRVEDLGGSYEA
jgi:hypothetical protein